MSDRSKRWSLIAFGIVFVLSFFWVDSEWKGGRVQAAGGAAAVATPIGLITWALVDRTRGGRRVLKGLLAAGVLLSLAGVYSYGAFTTPLFLAPLWLAAHRARGPEAVLWVALAAPCALITGWLLNSSFDVLNGDFAILFTGFVVVLFSWTALKQPVVSRA